MRIISGIYKSRKLFSPVSEKVRPTSDRAKETLFNVLSNKMEFENKICLDLFCGTGSLGLECLSRGSQKCYFIDKDIASVKKNVALLKAEDKSVILRSDVFSFLNEYGREKFDIIFCDPPFDFEMNNELISKISLLKTMLVLEHPAAFEISEDYKKNVYLKKKTGKIHFTFMDFN